MPESTCLHIQERESGPIRVVEIPWISVRIGRAAHCEVRLPEHDLAEEVCRLYRRRGSWHLVPGETPNPISIAGQPVDGLCPLPFDVPFRVGPYCLTLRHDRAAEPDWGMYSGPARGQLGRPPRALEVGHSAVAEGDPPDDGPGPDDGCQPATEPAIEPDAQPLTAAQGLAPNEELSRTASVRAGWESRWRVAGAELKARAQRTQTTVQSNKNPYQPQSDSVPLKPRRTPRVPPVVPTVEPAPRPIPVPRATAAGPAWTGPRVEPPAPDTFRATPPPKWTGGKVLPDVGQAFEPDVRPESLNYGIHSSTVPPRPPFAGTRPARERAAEVPVTRVPVEPSPQSFSESAAALHEHSLYPGVIDPHATSDDAAPDTASAIEPTQEITIPGGQLVDAASKTEPAPQPVNVDERVELPADPIAARVSPGDRDDRETDRPKDAFSAPLGFGPPAIDADPAQQPVGAVRPKVAKRRAASRPRRDVEPQALTPKRVNPDADVSRVEWPSAKDILASHRVSSRPQSTATAGRTTMGRRTGSGALPTLARGPDHWNMPVWLAGPPAVLLVFVTGLAACVMSWLWACDSYSASVMTDRLLTTDRSALRRPLPAAVAPPTGTWMRSTAQHLAHWALLLFRYEGESDYAPSEIAALLERALAVSPLNPTARLAVAQLEPPQNSSTVSIRSLGLSRDVLSLAWSARRLLAAGQKEAALKLYGRSLSIATTGASFRGAPARFSEDPRDPRYLLPGEERVRDIVRELAARSDWTFSQWSTAIPDSAIARLAAARLLREQGRSEAEALLDLIQDQRQTPAAPGKADPLTLAAQAEAYALSARWRDADQEYRRAIELIDDDTIKRSWWFNLADIAFRLDDENQRQAALRAALAVAASDDIARRATAIQRATRRQAGPRSTGVKAN